ncbi:MAG TPA: hypothetical protein VGC13_14210 [Longimicrobium sp.]|jgi:hypothetical protein|uniref:hypothetical protein n=1 Tax=Longimicrobium sp. TaxID=2029185 RepID=UPI002EDAB281
MIGLPEPLGAYLTAYDVLTRDAVLRAHAGLRDELQRPETRSTLLAWLASDDAWSPEGAGVLPAVLEFLRPAAVPSEAARVRPLLMHPDPPVRRGAFEFLLTLCFSGRNPEALLLLLGGMLMDEDETVRRTGADYASRAPADGELRDFLKRWLVLAPARGWTGSESYELVKRLLGAA